MVLLSNNVKKTIDALGVQKVEQKELEQSIKNKTDFIKNYMADVEEKEIYGNTYRAVIQESNKVSMDEDKVIEILKNNCKKEDYEKIIKTKEYVDFEALESFIYNNGIDAMILAPAQSIKTTRALYIKEIKKEKKDE